MHSSSLKKEKIIDIFFIRCLFIKLINYYYQIINRIYHTLLTYNKKLIHINIDKAPVLFTDTPKLDNQIISIFYKVKRY